MEYIVVVFCSVLLGLLSMAMLLGVARTLAMEASANQTAFKQGTLPHTLPDGFYQGNVPSGISRGSWQGKVFDAAKATGVNQFESHQQYHFKIYPSKGLRDKNIEVLRIDYSTVIYT